MVTSIVGDVYASGNGTTLTTQLQYPASIASGDKIYLFCLNNGGTAITTGTGITVPAGYALYGGSTATSDHVYNVGTLTRTWVKTAAGTETGGIGVTWGGGTATSRTFWAVVVVPGSYTENGFVYNDQASLTTASVTVPTVSHTGADLSFNLCFVKGSTDFASFTTTPATSGYTLVEALFGSGGSACSGGLAVNNTPDRDGTVGAGSWVTNTASSAARFSLTVVATLPRIVKTHVAGFDTLARVAKTLDTSWDVAAAVTRPNKTHATSWDVGARVVKTHAASWDTDTTAARVVKTHATSWDALVRATPKTHATSWDLRSMVSEVTYPAIVAHRGGDPGPEESLFAYETSYGKNVNFLHEADMQLLSDGTTVVFCHDDTINRTASPSSPITTGNVSSFNLAQWNTILVKTNTGYTGPDKPAGSLAQWVGEFGPGTATPAVAHFELKSGASPAAVINALNFYNLKGQMIVECDTLADAQALVAAGYTTTLLTDTPNFSQIVSNGISGIVVSMAGMTGTIGTNAAANGVKVWVYTVNSVSNKNSMLALGANGLLSNKPLTIYAATNVEKTFAASWDVKGRVIKTVAGSWDTRARVAKTHATTWDVGTRVAKTAANTWDVFARVAKTQATTYDVRFRELKTHLVQWDVAEGINHVTKTLAAGWDTFARVAKTSATTFDTLNRPAPKTVAASWDVVSPLTRDLKTHATSWDVRFRADKLHLVVYDVFSRGLATRATSWDSASLNIGPADGKVWHRGAWTLAVINAWDGDEWTGQTKTWNGTIWI